MSAGAIMGQIDVAQVTLFAFWIFFFGLLMYLQRESRREGYPLEEDTSGKLENHGGTLPKPKTFKLFHGGETHAPTVKRDSDRGELKMKRTAVWPGAPYVPTGDGMKDGVGPASYALRADTPEMTAHNEAKIQPLSKVTSFAMASGDPSLVGFTVLAGDGKIAGEISDVWVDVGEQLIRYVEIELVEPKGKKVLAPMTLTQVKRSRRQVVIKSIMANQFDGVPTTKKDDQVTLLEEDMICAYYCGGILMATPARAEALL